jgi:hypothetical protein
MNLSFRSFESIKGISLIICFFLICPCVIAQDSPETFPEIPPLVLSENLNQDVKSIDPMQSRLFKTTDIRKQVNLAGFWNFVTDPDSTGEEKNYQVSEARVVSENILYTGKGKSAHSV